MRFSFSRRKTQRISNRKILTPRNFCIWLPTDHNQHLRLTQPCLFEVKKENFQPHSILLSLISAYLRVCNTLKCFQTPISQRSPSTVDLKGWIISFMSVAANQNSSKLMDLKAEIKGSEHMGSACNAKSCKYIFISILNGKALHRCWKAKTESWKH